MRLRGVVEALDERMRSEQPLHRGALHANSAAVNQAHFPEALLMRGVQVFLDDRRNVTRLEGVEVDFWLDRNLVGHTVLLDFTAEFAVDAESILV
jgi:hypothetical protein